MSELKPNEVQLSDSRVVAIRELSGSDDIRAKRIAGGEFGKDASTTAAGAMLYQDTLVALSIESIDGKDVQPPIVNMGLVQNLWSKFKLRDKRVVEKKYNELNEPQAGPAGEPTGPESTT